MSILGGVVLGIVVISFLVLLHPLIFFLLTQIWVNLGYALWRISGGLKRTRGSKKVWEYVGLLNPHPCCAEKYKEYLMKFSITSIPEHFRAKLVVPGDGSSITLKRLNRENAKDESLGIAKVIFAKVFLVNPMSLKMGCHGFYSLPKAIFLANHFGGDPRCGGGIKAFKVPLRKLVVQYFILKRILRKPAFQAFVMEMDDGAIGSCYKVRNNSAMETSITIYIGDEEVVRQFAQFQRLSVRPVTVSIS